MVKVEICIGSSCHVKGARLVLEEIQRLVAEHNLKDEVELAGKFCVGKCAEGVCVTVDGKLFSVTPQETKAFFEKEILGRVKL